MPGKTSLGRPRKEMLSNIIDEEGDKKIKRRPDSRWQSLYMRECVLLQSRTSKEEEEELLQLLSGGWFL